MTPSRAVRWLVAASVACGGVLAAVPRVAARDPGEDLLEQAQQAAATYDYSGVVVVEWSDGVHRHTEQVRVVGSRGTLTVGDHGIVSTGTRRLVRGRDDWLMVWNTGEVSAYPSPEGKYALTVRAGPEVAGRSTTVVDAVLADSGTVRERLFVDDDSGLLLRREQLDERGRVVRAMGFTQISEPAASASTGRLRAPQPRMPEHRLAPRPVDRVSGPFRAPTRAGNGYQLVGRYRHPDGTLQLLYTDGLLSMSVFEQRGRIDWGALPAGRSTELAGQRARTYDVPGGQAVVWARDELVFTCVTDAPMAELAPVVDALRARHHPGVVSSIARTLLGPFSWR